MPATELGGATARVFARGWRRILSTTVAAVVVAGCYGTSVPPLRTGGVILYGDSFSDEAGADFAGQLDTLVTHRHYGGTATCDWISSMTDDIDTIQPDAVVMQFQGNNVTDCIADRDLSSTYYADATTATSLFASRGIPVYWVTPVPSPGETRHPLDAVFRRVVQDARALGQPVRLVDGGVDMRDANGVYRYLMPCLSDEGPEEGCGEVASGQIRVRTGADDPHLCTVSGEHPCATYSSGAARFARNMAAPLKADLGL